MRLASKVAAVTGAASGIGKAIALRFATEGAFVVCVDRNLRGCETAVAQITESGGMAAAIECDVTQPDQIEQLMRYLDEKRGGLDILLNGAGVMLSQPMLETTRESFQKTLDVNLLAVFFILQAAAQLMIKKERRGRIINIASIAARQGNGAGLQYCASKAGVISVTQSAALALCEHGIAVNAIAPGYIQTAMWDEIHRQFVGGPRAATAEEFDRTLCATVPMKRLGVPADIAGTAVFLASADADYIVGQTFNVDGGLVLS